MAEVSKANAGSTLPRCTSLKASPEFPSFGGVAAGRGGSRLGTPRHLEVRPALALSGIPLLWRGGRRPGWSHWVGRLPSIHDSRFTFTSPHRRRQVVGRLPSGSRFTIHIHISSRASAGGRQVALGFTIHDSHSRPPASVGKWSAGCLRVHDSRFTFTSPHGRRQVVGKSALADSPTRRAVSRRESSVSLRRERGVCQLGVGTRWVSTPRPAR